jgi:hypothetical protein
MSLPAATPARVPCFECVENEAVRFCIQCDKDTCASCDEAVHSLRSFAEHTRVKLAAKPAPAPKCKLHPSRNIELFCADCRDACCALCAVTGAHKGHECSMIAAVLLRERTALEAAVARCKVDLAAAEQVSAVINQQREQYGKDRDRFVARLCADADVIRAALSAKVDEMKQRIEAHAATYDRYEFAPLVAAFDGNRAAANAARAEAASTAAISGVSFIAAVRDQPAQLEARADTCRKLAAETIVPQPVLEYALEPHSHDGQQMLHVGAIAKHVLAAIAALDAHLEACIVDVKNLIVDGVVALASDRVHEYQSIIVRRGGVLTVAAWNAETRAGGVLRVRVARHLVIEEGGAIDVSGKGCPGGAGVADAPSFQGTCAATASASASCAANASAGGGGRAASAFGSIGGGGGGYGTAGADAELNRLYGQSNAGGVGGAAFGDSSSLEEDALPVGAGGGGGSGCNGLAGGCGGAGGGALSIAAGTLVNRGTILANGAAGASGSGNRASGGGGGSGGSIRIAVRSLGGGTAFGRVRSEGGARGEAGPNAGHRGICSAGGAGGAGRIRVALAAAAAAVDIADVQPAPFVG